jgi:hypothetical protein
MEACAHIKWGRQRGAVWVQINASLPFARGHSAPWSWPDLVCGSLFLFN